MATTLTRPMTVEEFAALPETGRRFELHNGELFQGIEFAFRALPEYEFRIADVAYITKERWDQIDRKSNLRGAPDLVVEVLSPSNTAAEMSKKKRLCLENGCREFWVLDADLRQVEVSTPDGITTTYRDGQEIALRLFGSGTLKVNDIFS
jgi:Uma2 family endonuclease